MNFGIIFDSAPGVLTFTNYIFSQLMEKEFWRGWTIMKRQHIRPGDGGPMMQDEENFGNFIFPKRQCIGN